MLWNTSLIVNFWVVGFKTSKASNCFFPFSSIVSLCFSKVLTKGEYVNLAYSITLLWSKGSISSTVKNSYLSMLPDDTAIFAASLLKSPCNFSSLIWSSIAIISFYILSKRFLLKCERIEEKRKEASITKKEYGFAVHF